MKWCPGILFARSTRRQTLSDQSRTGFAPLATLGWGQAPRPTNTMIHSLLFFLTCPIAAPVAAPILPPEPTPVLFQDEEEKPDKRPEIKELVDAFAGHIKKRGEEDREALAEVDSMLGEWEMCGPKDRKDIIRILSRSLNEKRKADKDGRPNNMLFVAVAVAFGRMGPESAPELMKWIENKKHRKDVTLQRQLVLSLGKTVDDKGRKLLIDLLVNKYAAIQAAAAEALGNYSKKDQKVRKEVFEEVLKVLNSAYNAKEGATTDREAQERYDVIAASMITTLQGLSGATIRTPNDWRKWWNDNKHKKWDDV